MVYHSLEFHGGTPLGDTETETLGVIIDRVLISEMPRNAKTMRTCLRPISGTLSKAIAEQ